MEIIIFGQADSSNVLIQPVDNHDLSYIDKEAELIKEAVGDGWCLTAVKVDNWNDDLSPWSALPFSETMISEGGPWILCRRF